MSQSIDTTTGEFTMEAPAPLGPLAILPRELREIIYESIFRTGHTSILMVSKALHEDAKGSVGRHRIRQIIISHHELDVSCRILDRYSTEQSLISLGFTNVTKLKIRIVLSHINVPLDLELKKTDLFRIMMDIVLPIKDRICCHVDLELPRQRQTLENEVIPLWWLRGFVTVTVVVGPPELLFRNDNLAVWEERC